MSTQGQNLVEVRIANPAIVLESEPGSLFEEFSAMYLVCNELQQNLTWHFISTIRVFFH